MTASDTNTRRPYAGRGIAAVKVPGERSAVRLPAANQATLLPDPSKAYAELLDRFFEVTGLAPGSRPEDREPVLRPRELTLLANYVTFALRNDLPQLERHDAAVIWEKWRQAVAKLRAGLRVADRERHAPRVANELHIGTWAIREDLATARTDPGRVAERYCPWKADFFTFERLHPEAV